MWLRVRRRRRSRSSVARRVGTATVDVSTTRSAASRSGRRRSRSAAMPSTSRPSPCSGMAAAHLLEPADEHGVGRLEEQQPRAVAAGVEVLDHRREVRGERAAAHVHDDGDAGDLAAGAGAEVDHRGDQLGRQVVDDEPAQVLQHLRRSAAAGPGQTADQRHVDAVRMLRRCRRMLGHAFSRCRRCRERGRLPIRAARSGPRRPSDGPNPGTAAISSTLAALSLRTDPKCLSSAVRREGPSPGTPSSAEAVMPLERRWRW